MLAYKYRGDIERDISSIEKDYFWAPNLDGLNDPCEAIIDSDSFRPRLQKIFEILTNKHQPTISALNKLFVDLDDILKSAQEAGIFSLSTIFDNELLWAHYANSHKGFCIEYDTTILGKNRRYDFYILDIIYSKTPPEITEHDIMNLKGTMTAFFQKIIGTKSTCWSYEKEIRIITDKSGKQPHDFRAVKGIYFGLRMPDDQKQQIMERLKGRGIKYYQIKLEGSKARGKNL